MIFNKTYYGQYTIARSMNHFLLLELCYSILPMTEQGYLPILIESWKGNSSLFQKEELFGIAHRVRQISHGLTRNRELAGSPYLDDPVSLGAYLCYYWPVSYRAASFLLSTLPLSLKKTDSALDIGAGAGPVTFALTDQGIKKVVACDRSEKALRVLRRIASRRNVAIQTLVLDLEQGDPLPPGPFKLITLGNLLNELWKNEPDRIKRRFLLVKSLLPSLAPGGRIVILEPALSSISRELLQVRDLLTSDGELYVEAPCFRQAHCPALPEGVCHREIPWNPPPLVREIGRRARVSDRHSVKISYLVLKSALSGAVIPYPPPLPNSPEGLPHRVVSDPLTSKSGRVRYLVCGLMGRFPLSADRARAIPPNRNKEGRKPDLRKSGTTGGRYPKERGVREILRDSPPFRDPFDAFFSLKRGDVVVFQHVEKRETGYGIQPGSVLRILNREGGLG